MEQSGLQNMRFYDVVVAGAGQAGMQVVLSLRQGGFAGAIALLGDEPDAPYERPPLSKAYLAGDMTADQLAFKLPEFWQENNIDLRLQCRVTRIDALSRTAFCIDGTSFKYENLVWAAGGQPRSLSCEGSDLSGIHVVRTRAQIDHLRDELAAASRIAIIGGGYIGLETAAVLSKAGKSVLVLEAQNRLLARVAGNAISEFFEAHHQAHGVQIRTGVTVVGVTGRQGRVSALSLNDGSEVPADIVIVGIGLIPETAPLREAGAICGNGIEVDPECRTNLAGVFAIGDCASRINPYAGGAWVRLESVQSAVEQAKTAATAILGGKFAGYGVPWFWSHQYELKLQTAGLSAGYDETVLRGEPETAKFSVVYLRENKVIALDCVNATKDFIQGRELVARHAAVPHSVLADPGSDLRPYLVQNKF